MDSIIQFFTTPSFLMQALINGMVIGALFSLAAYGLALVWGVMNIINVAQGDFVILGGYVAFYALGISTPFLEALQPNFFSRILLTPGILPLLSIPIASSILFVFGYLLYKVIIYRIVSRDLFTSLLATFGISLALQQLMNLSFGADVQFINTGLPTLFFMDDLVALPVVRLFSLILASILSVFIVIFLKKSKMGLAIRAVSQNARAAALIGVNTDRVYAFTFALNTAICGACGALVGMIFNLHPYIGTPYTVRSFMIVIFAGLGNLPAVILSALGLGVFEESADFMFGAELRLAFVFSLLVFVLVFRNWRLSKKREYLK